MRIYVKQNDIDKPIDLHIPNAIVFNKISNLIISKNTNIPQAHIDRLIEELKLFGHFNIIHVESDNGQVIDIDL